MRVVLCLQSSSQMLPCQWQADEHRRRVFMFVKDVVKTCLGAHLLPVGAVPGRCYVPDSPLCVSAFLCAGQEKGWFMKVNELLCLRASQQEVPTTPRTSKSDASTISPAAIRSLMSALPPTSDRKAGDVLSSQPMPSIPPVQLGTPPRPSSWGTGTLQLPFS